MESKPSLCNVTCETERCLCAQLCSSWDHCYYTQLATGNKCCCANAALVAKRWKKGNADNCGHRWLVWSKRWQHKWTMKVDLPQMPAAWLKWDGEPPGRREWSPHPDMHKYLLEQPLGLMP